MVKEELVLTTEDGFAISCLVFAPGGNAKGGVVINSATAVRQSYYEKFAKFLTEQGYIVITYDYRGIGRSSVANSRNRQLKMKAWGKYDLEAVISWAKANHGELDWHCVGHSVGGQILGFAESNNFFKSVYCVSSQSGYWGHWEGMNKARIFAMWFAIVPLLSTVFGKVPGVFLGGESLPEPIAKQWAYWGRHPHYIVDKQGTPIRSGFEQLSCKMKFLQIDDDYEFAPPKSVQALASFYQQADVEVAKVSSKEHGSRIGHFGFFRSKHQQSLWQDALGWLELQSS
ncbi:alpha/beta fold hydrolase [Vibrio fortis]|uniref:alpha/beta hydrolase family protein n=1 Tax=Vibrio fortis TaxID=212667 RepID=UPI002F3E43DA